MPIVFTLQLQDFAYSFVELPNISVCPVLQPVQVLLNCNTLISCVSYSFQFCVICEMLKVHFVLQFSSLMKRLNSTRPSTQCTKRQHWTHATAEHTNCLGETYEKYRKVNHSLSLLNALAENNPGIIHIGFPFTRKLTVQDCRGWQATFINTNTQFSTLYIARQLLNRLVFSL